MDSRFDGDTEDAARDEQPMDAPATLVADDSGVLFEGDTGLLKSDTRHVIVQLLLGPAMDARRQSKLWQVLLRDEKDIRSRLHELFLDLIVDREQQVAFTRQVKGDFPILLRRAALNFMESVLLIYLRMQLTQAESQIEMRSVVSLQDMREHLKVFGRDDNVDHSGFEARIDKAIEKLHKHGFLHKLGRNTDRFEVSPTLKILVSADEVQALTRKYTELVTQDAVAPDADDADEVPPSQLEDAA